MKLSSDTNPAANLIRAYGPGFFIVNEVRHDTSIILSADRLRPCERVHEPDDIDGMAIADMQELEPEILLIGTGARHRWPNGEIMGRLAAMGAGVEVMRSDAACRTYNVLVGEARRVVALLMLVRDG